MYIYFQYEKGRMERKRVAEAAKGVGRPKVGGKFELVDQDGRKFTDEDMKGKYALVSPAIYLDAFLSTPYTAPTFAARHSPFHISD